jgi:hypothetical protein
MTSRPQVIMGTYVTRTDGSIIIEISPVVFFGFLGTKDELGWRDRQLFLQRSARVLYLPDNGLTFDLVMATNLVNDPTSPIIIPPNILSPAASKIYFL